MKGFVISAPSSGSGKTTVTLGLLAALRKLGIPVQPFKVGPDFIDTGLHEIAAGVPSHNLDGWMLKRKTNEWLFERAAAGKEVAIIEGVMGLYDGSDGGSEQGSTAEMAKWLGLPVVLVVDAHAMARSAAALVRGFRQFDPEVQIAGVIFNRLAGERHYRMLKDAVRDAPILGWLPVNPSIEIPERHLGLLTAPEVTAAKIREIGKFVAAHVDVRALFDHGLEQKSLAADPLPTASRPSVPLYQGDNGFTVPLIQGDRRAEGTAGGRSHAMLKCRVAIAQDKAFSFYYHANRMALEEAGAKIIEFSPLADKEVPDADFLYIGGGYPELYRQELEANISMRTSIRKFIESGKRFYAECGGLMYLSRSIGGSEMVGIVPAEIEMTERLVDFGYCEVTTSRASIVGPAGTNARGHQFHYSRCVSGSGEAYQVRQGQRNYAEGFAFPNGLASYIHLHFLSNPALARNMLNS
ncbi:MAG TPA: cobyrinate a,c-diamide synthase [Terriglobia bacterium]|jgi:cobyrinic acid a,c-diamide synthase